MLFISYSQNSTDDIDNNYREDQFYVSVTYNVLDNKPAGISQSGFSRGFHLGFIRDMPINKQRNWAIGLGVGLSANTFNQNLLIDKNQNAFQYSITDDTGEDVSKNKFSNYLIEIPLELRWRTSSPTEYNFWRIYFGLKFGYLLINSAKYESNVRQVNLSNISDFNDFQYGLTLSAGYGNWNFQLYYGLNTIFDKNAFLNEQSIDLRALKIGIIFYLL